MVFDPVKAYLLQISEVSQKISAALWAEACAKARVDALSEQDPQTFQIDVRLSYKRSRITRLRLEREKLHYEWLRLEHQSEYVQQLIDNHQ